MDEPWNMGKIRAGLQRSITSTPPVLALLLLTLCRRLGLPESSGKAKGEPASHSLRGRAPEALPPHSGGESRASHNCDVLVSVPSGPLAGIPRGLCGLCNCHI